jgi:hypothetical protein
VGLLVFGQVTWAFEFFVTAWFTATFGSKLCRGGRAFAASHRAQDRLVLFCLFAQGSLESNSVFAVFIEVNWFSSGDRDGLSVLLDSDKLSRTAVLCESAVEFDFVRSGTEAVSIWS